MPAIGTCDGAAEGGVTGVAVDADEEDNPDRGAGVPRVDDSGVVERVDAARCSRSVSNTTLDSVATVAITASAPDVLSFPGKSSLHRSYQNGGP